LPRHVCHIPQVEKSDRSRNLDGIIDLARDGFALDYSKKAAELALTHLKKG
jgi:hypothetical protein